MEIINKFFENLIFTRIDEKQNYVIYGAGVASMFGGGIQRYILLFVPSHLAIKTHARIGELMWKNLQTRKLKYSYKLKQQTWKIPENVVDIELIVVKREKEYSKYSAPNFPFEVLLLHDPNKKTTYQYHNKIMLSSAFETFDSVFNYNSQLLSSQGNYDEPTSPMPPPINQIDDSFSLI